MKRASDFSYLQPRTENEPSQSQGTDEDSFPPTPNYNYYPSTPQHTEGNWLHSGENNDDDDDYDIGGSLEISGPINLNKEPSTPTASIFSDKIVKKMKKVNVINLKNSLWVELCNEGVNKELNKNSNDSSSDEESSNHLDESKMQNIKLFSQLYSSIPLMAPKNCNVQEISPAMTFLMVLHLAHERDLEIQNVGNDFSDLVIAPETNQENMVISDDEIEIDLQENNTKKRQRQSTKGKKKI